ncbi:MAG: protein translocase subunit SecF [Candidatus Paceibacterota bacterium]|jgi:preprotein translocase subunit SecF
MFIIKNKKIFIWISISFAVIAIALLSVFGLKFGIDFKGGALTEVVYTDGQPEINVLQEKLNGLDLGSVLIQPTGDNGYLVKTKDLTEVERLTLFDSFSFDGKYKAEQKSFTSIGPSVGKELAMKSLFSIIFVSIAIILFIAYAFRKVSKPVSSWRYGIITIITLLYDAIIPVGIFAIFSHYLGAEVDTLFVVALLTILGISINDKIVVFDRVRENLRGYTGGNFSEIVGKSITQTITRSINTSLTVIFVLLALYFFGPTSTKYFALMLTAGMFFGTYSSIFLASPLLVLTEEMQTKKARK